MPSLEGTPVQALLVLGVQMGSPGCSLRLYVLVLDCLCLAAFNMNRRPWAVPGWPQWKENSPVLHTTIPGQALIGCGQGLEYLIGQWGHVPAPWGGGGDL